MNEYNILVPERIKTGVDADGYSLVSQKTDEFALSLYRAIKDLIGMDPLKVFRIVPVRFKNTDNEITEVKCCDRVIGTVYASRTEFNNLDVVFAAYTDVFPYIKETAKELIERMS